MSEIRFVTSARRISVPQEAAQLVFLERRRLRIGPYREVIARATGYDISQYLNCEDLRILALRLETVFRDARKRDRLLYGPAWCIAISAFLERASRRQMAGAQIIKKLSEKILEKIEQKQQMECAAIDEGKLDALVKVFKTYANAGASSVPLH